MVSSQKLTLAMLVLTSMLTSCSAAKLESTQYSGEIEIDGSAREWSRGVYWFEDEALRVGLQNDGVKIYILIASKERTTASLLARAGLLLSISAKEGSFGIKLAGSHMGDRPIRQPDEMKPENRPKPEWSIGNEFVYIDKKKNEIILERDFAAKEGLTIEAGYTDDDFVIEMAVPLTEGYFAISPRMPETITMKIESSFKIEAGMPKEGMGESPRGEGRGRPSGDFGGGGQGGPPGGGGRGGPSGGANFGPSESISSIKLKFKVVLSSSLENEKVGK